MKKEISRRADVELLVNSFYEKVLNDEILRPIFIDIAKIELKEHLPHLYSFWESVLLGEGNYRGNPMEVHISLNKKIPLTKDIFTRWLNLFHETIDELFFGDKAEEAKKRASSIAQLMQFKIEELN